MGYLRGLNKHLEFFFFIEITTASQFFLHKTSIFTCQGQTFIELTRESLTKKCFTPALSIKCYWSTATRISVFQGGYLFTASRCNCQIKGSVLSHHGETRDPAGDMLIIIVSLITLPLENDVNMFLTVIITWPRNNHEDEVEHELYNDNNNNGEYGKKGNAKIALS